MPVTTTPTVPYTPESFYEAQEAIADGRATELWPCVQCLPLHERLVLGAESRAPLRGATGTHVAGTDPSEVIHLHCGHYLF